MEVNNSATRLQLSDIEFAEMIKRLAMINEKMFLWEMSMNHLDKVDDDDPNKVAIKEIIDFIEQDKSSSRERAVYLFGELAQYNNKRGSLLAAAKAFERAATLRFDCHSRDNIIDDEKAEDISNTVQYMEGAIGNYMAIGKLKQAGKLHLRCSRMLRLINAPEEEIKKHHDTATEYFNKFHDEIKKRVANKEDQQHCFAPRMKRGKFFFSPTYEKYRELSDNCSRAQVPYNENEAGSSSTNPHMITSMIDTPIVNPIMNPTVNPIMSHTKLITKQVKSLDNRIEAARRLVKKLRRMCAFYEVVTEGEQAGKVWCKMCERYLGAVSSTLKNHINTQEHKEGNEELKRNQVVTGSGASPIRIESIDFSWLQTDGTSGTLAPNCSSNSQTNNQQIIL